MKNEVLQTIGLTKTYDHKLVLDQVSITLEKGNIYGFVGQNGAGKTTFMRLVAGLSIPDKGGLRLFGTSDRGAIPDRHSLSDQRKRMGCMIETPAFYPYMSAGENMEAVRIGRGIPNKEAVSRVLKLVGLADEGKKRLRNFSLGMKQRLGIAVALIGEPEFLMLDEPINGLDPVSIVEIRELLIRLADERQLTILLSSHILGELYHLATNYIIIHEGRILQEITKEQLDLRCKKHIHILVNNVPLATTVLERTLHTGNYKVMPDRSILLYDFVDEVQKVITAFSDNALVIKDISISGDTLENYFLNMTGGGAVNDA